MCLEDIFGLSVPQTCKSLNMQPVPTYVTRLIIHIFTHNPILLYFFDTGGTGLSLHFCMDAVFERHCMFQIKKVL